MYIHELKDWPHFFWDFTQLADLLIQLRHSQGRLIGSMESVGFQAQEETVLETLTQDVVKSSQIEGEILDPSLVRSSVARHLGMDIGALPSTDRNIDGVVEMMLDATQRFDLPLTKKRLFDWHAWLFPSGRSGFSKIRIGAWRKGPVEVVSGRMGKEAILRAVSFLNFEDHHGGSDLIYRSSPILQQYGPPHDKSNLSHPEASKIQESNRAQYIHFEAPPAGQVEKEMELFLDWLNNESKIDLVLKAAIAHFWFVTIHPFDDASNVLEKILKKIQFWENLAEISLNDRQKKMIHRLLDGFEGKLTSSKWAKIGKCSQDTAYRDILDLMKKGILIKSREEGRSTSYSLKTSHITKN